MAVMIEERPHRRVDMLAERDAHHCVFGAVVRDPSQDSAVRADRRDESVHHVARKRGHV
jgi:hypothetical protein